MKLLALLPLLLCSCAGGTFSGLGSSTTIFENGKPVLTSSGNMQRVHYHKTASTTEFSADLLVHDKATAAQWNGLNSNVDAWGNNLTKAGAAWKDAHTLPPLPSIPTR